VLATSAILGTMGALAALAAVEGRPSEKASQAQLLLVQAGCDGANGRAIEITRKR
jgi:hypothetical protein